jgi:hypothetical protein
MVNDFMALVWETIVFFFFIKTIPYLAYKPHLLVVAGGIRATALHFIAVHVFHFLLLLFVLLLLLLLLLHLFDHLIRRDFIVNAVWSKAFQNGIQFFLVSLFFENHILWGRWEKIDFGLV